MHGSNPALREERSHAKAEEVERLRRGRYCRQLREAAGISLETMANRTFRDKSTLSRFENGKTTPADFGLLLTQYEELGDPVATSAQRTSNLSDRWVAALLVSLGFIALLSGLVPDEDGVDVIRVGAIAVVLVTIALMIRALRYRVISPWLGAAALLCLGGPAIVVAVRLGDPAQGVRGGDGIVLLLASACALIWLKQDVEDRIRVKRADAKIAAGDAAAKVA